MDPLRRDEDYHSLFDTGSYLSGYYSKLDEPFTRFYLSALHDIYKQGISILISNYLKLNIKVLTTVHTHYVVYVNNL